jgi:hypothetical protein
MKYRPFSAEHEFTHAIPSDDSIARLKYMATTNDGRIVLKNMCTYDVPEALAFLFRSLWGVRAPPEFRSIKGDRRAAWEFHAFDALNRKMYKRYTGFKYLATRFRKIVIGALGTFQAEYLTKHAPDLFRDFPRVTDLTTTARDTVHTYLMKEIENIVTEDHHAQHVEYLKNLPMSRIPTKYHVFDDRSPTGHVDVRRDYLVNTDEGRTIMETLATLDMDRMPAFVFEQLWGREAPARFQSFVSGTKCLYEYVDVGAVDDHFIVSRTLRDPTDGTPLVAEDIVAKLAMRMSRFLFEFLLSVANVPAIFDAPEYEPLKKFRCATNTDIQFASRSLRNALVRMMS